MNIKNLWAATVLGICAWQMPASSQAMPKEELSKATIQFIEGVGALTIIEPSLELEIFEAVREQIYSGSITAGLVKLDDGLSIQLGQIMPIDNDQFIITDLPRLNVSPDELRCLAMVSNSELLGTFAICGSEDTLFPAPASLFAKSCEEEKIEYLRNCGCGFVSPFSDPPESFIKACEIGDEEAAAFRSRCLSLFQIGSLRPDAPICQR